MYSRALAPVSAKREAGTASGAPAKKKPKAAPAAAAKTGRRRERQKRNADVRSGLKPLPTPIVDFDAEAARGMLTLTREGVPVHLPRARPPYRSAAPGHGRRDPSGAGRAVGAARVADEDGQDPRGARGGAGLAAAARARHADARRLGRAHARPAAARRPRVQAVVPVPAAHVAAALARAAVLPAPEHRDGAEQGRGLRGGGEDRQALDEEEQGLRAHLDKAERIGYPQGRRSGGRTFASAGRWSSGTSRTPSRRTRRRHVCPFHMAQDQIQEGAALIFITYSQLVDPVIRRAGGLDAVLEDAVVVVDEGHNLPSVARDAASYEVTEDRLADMVKTLEEFAPHLGEYPGAGHAREPHRAAAGVLRGRPGAARPPPPTKRKKKPKLRFRVTARGGPLRSLLAWLRGATAPTCAAAPLGAPATRKRDAFKDEEERIWRGADAATLVRDVLGLENAERVDEHCKMLWKMRKDLIDEGLESGAVRSDTINDLEAILVKLRYLLDPAAATRYKLIATSAPRLTSSRRARRGPRATRATR